MSSRPGFGGWMLSVGPRYPTVWATHAVRGGSPRSRIVVAAVDCGGRPSVGHAPHSNSAWSKSWSRAGITRAGPWLAMACAGVARAASQRQVHPRIDSHLHLWTPDTEKYPCEVEPPEHLNKDGRATFENFIALMDASGVDRAVVVQPVNYGQDYSYLQAAMDAHPDRLFGMFVADPRVPASDAAAWLDGMKSSHNGWVGVRFNPYKWPADSQIGMADDTGKALFRRAGELGLVVGFMPFKGLSTRVDEIEQLLVSSPETKVIIDHWGFFLQPALGFGDDRTFDEESWRSLLRLSSYSQVHVKASALFRVAKDTWPFASLSDRLRELLTAFGSQRILWGSDFPFATEHTDYDRAVHAVEAWPIWDELPDADRANIIHNTAASIFALPSPSASSPDASSGNGQGGAEL